MSIRNAVKAIIIQEDKILLIKNKGGDSFYYICPGGGQHQCETIPDALQRECMEELGCEVIVGDMLFLREYIGDNHEYAAIHSGAHQIEYYFACTLKDETASIKPVQPDNEQVGVEWVPLADISHYNFFPKEMKQSIIDFYHSSKRSHRSERINESSIYLGDIN